MKAKHHRAILMLTECIQGLLIIALIIAILGIGTLDNYNEWNDITPVFFGTVGRVLYILSAIGITEILRRFARHMYRLTRAKEKRAQRTAIQSGTQDTLAQLDNNICRLKKQC